MRYYEMADDVWKPVEAIQVDWQGRSADDSILPRGLAKLYVLGTWR